MAVTFSDACERDIRRARYVRVAVYQLVADAVQRVGDVERALL